MKFTCSYTDRQGLTVSLAVSVPPSYYQSSDEGSGLLYEEQDLESLSFEQAIPQLSPQLLQTHSAIELALLDSFNRNLKNYLDTKEAFWAETEEKANNIGSGRAQRKE